MGGLAHGLGSNPTSLGQKPPKGESQDKWNDGKKAETMGTEGKRILDVRDREAGDGEMKSNSC